MKVLLDHNIPRQLAPLLEGLEAIPARDLRWDGFRNGLLLQRAEEAGFTAMVTGDKGIYYQQNNAKRTISLVLVTRTKRRLLRRHVNDILAALARAQAASFEVVTVQDEPRKIR